MIRASSAHRICTDKPELDDTEFALLERELKNKVEAKLQKPYHRDNLEKYRTTHGLMTDTKNFYKYLDTRSRHLADELPQGACTYVEEMWLEDNADLVDQPQAKEAFSTEKGTLSELGAIGVLNQAEGKLYQRYAGPRVIKDFLSGHWDIYHETHLQVFMGRGPLDKVVRDIKVPKHWKSFRSKYGITKEYYWQLVTYMYLSGATSACVDYVLMPTPDAMLENALRYLSDADQKKYMKVEKAIVNLKPAQRVKTFWYQGNYEEDIKFLRSRAEKAEKYYKTLTYDKCMNM